METETVSKPKKKSSKEKEPEKNYSKAYNQFKNFGNQQYTGMKVGRSHKWYYDKGEWYETKLTPDLWEISYNVIKRRAGHAPEGSGVPVGTEYHWFILANQNVKKLDANDYTTEMTGIKYKLAFKRAGNEKWNATPKTERKRLVKLLKDFIIQLEKEPVPIQFEYKQKEYSGEAIPTPQVCNEEHCTELGITINEQNLGIIHCTDKGWKMKNVKDQKFVDAIGNQIALWYQQNGED
ncbi:MAG TPA: hypothetical protein VLI68_11740 [Hanamia sp.]|jgi:hypothetical protein|nr:hypothetical protein [Hanamia sp.]